MALVAGVALDDLAVLESERPNPFDHDTGTGWFGYERIFFGPEDSRTIVRCSHLKVRDDGTRVKMFLSNLAAADGEGFGFESIRAGDWYLASLNEVSVAPIDSG